MAFGLDLGNVLAHVKMDASQYLAGIKGIQAATRKMGTELTRIGRSMTLRVTAPIVALGAASVKAFASFDDAMTKSLAIMGDVSAEMRAEMEKTAIQISNQSVTSAKDLAKAYFFLASAGFSAEQSIAALASVEKFAVAGAFDMATATDLVTDAQSALGLKSADAQKNMLGLVRVGDVLVKANTLANATVEQFSLALTSEAGPAMKAYNIELEEGVAVLAAYADQGIKAQKAGSMFGRMLRLMTKGFKDNRAAWQKFGIDIFDANREIRPLADIVKDLTNTFSTMSTEQKIANLELLGFTARSQQTILPLLGMGNAIERYNELLKEAGGITEEVANNQLTSFSAQMKIMWNQIVNAAAAFGNILAPSILKMNEHIKKAIDWWNKLSDSTKKWIVFGMGIAAAIGPALIAFGLMATGMAAVIGVFVSMISIAGLVIGAILGIAAVAYVVRAVWKQNAEAIKIILQSLLDVFTIFFDHLSNTLVGKFVEFFVNSFKTGFKEIVTGARNFTRDMSGLLAGGLAVFGGIKAGVGLEGLKSLWANAFIVGSDAMDKMRGQGDDFVAATFEAAGKVLGKIKDTAVQGVAAIWADVKAQFKVDFNDLLAFIKSKFPELTAEIDALITKMKEIDTAIAFSPEDFTGLDEFFNRFKEGAEETLGFLESLKQKGKELFQSWVQANENAFENMKNVASAALDGVSDALTDLVLKGKADFNALAASIVADITKVIIKAQIANALMGVFGIDIAGAASIQKVQVVNAAGASIQSNHSGGLVTRQGPLRSDEVLSKLQLGEVVLNRDEVKQIRGRDTDGGRGGGVTNIYEINAVDPQSFFQLLNRDPGMVASVVENAQLSGNHPSRRQRDKR